MNILSLVHCLRHTRSLRFCGCIVPFYDLFCFNPSVLKPYFYLSLRQVYELWKFPSTRLWNVSRVVIFPFQFRNLEFWIWPPSFSQCDCGRGKCRWRKMNLLHIWKREKSIGKTILSQEEFENTKGVIRIRISKKNRQHIG